jgi:hypothetical protein
MADQQHRATADEWASVKALASSWVAYSTILELRDRIEALESTAQPNYPEKPDSSLVKGVAAVIDNGGACDRQPDRIARDVIRAVAVWLREQKHSGHAWSIRFEKEAER